MAILTDDQFLQPPDASQGEVVPVPPAAAAQPAPPLIDASTGQEIAPPMPGPSPAAGGATLSDAQFLATPDTLTSAADYGATDEAVRGLSFGGSDALRALAMAGGDWLKGDGFDYGTSLGKVQGGRALYESAHPYLAPAASALGGMAMMGGGGGLNAAARTLPGALGSAGIGAGTGAISGATENSASPGSAAEGALKGAGLGFGAGLLTPTVANLISPSVSPGLQTLLSAKVAPTPGQLARGFGGPLGYGAGRLEEMASSFPGPGDVIKWGQAGAVKDFNRGAINQRALAPIGQTLDAEPGTRAAIGEMQSKISDAYDNLVPTLGWDTQSPGVATLNTGLGTLKANVAATLPPAHAQIFNDDIDRLVGQRVSPGGGITGPSFKEAYSDLGQRAVGLTSNPSGDFWDKKLGSAFFQAQQTLRDAQNVADPVAGAAMAKVDEAYANSLRITNAATRGGSAEPGLFSPAQLTSATRSLDPSLRKGAFARGDALMQDYAEAGKQILGNRLPDSGTASRGLVTLLAGSLLGGGAHEAGLVSPSTLMRVGGAMGAAGALYSPLGRRALTAAMTQRPQWLEPPANLVRGATPGLSAYLSGLTVPAPAPASPGQ